MDGKRVVRAFGVDIALEPGGFDRPRGGKPLAHLPDGSGGAILSVHEHRGTGIVVDAGGRGRFLIEPGAERVLCDAPDGSRQRILEAQVLPLVAALRGLHVIHASAVAIDGGAVALAGASGAGKSTLAAELARMGHPLVAEDVLALRLAGGAVLAEPGVSTVLGPLPLRTLYLLGEAQAGRPTLEPLPAPSPRELLATAFVPYLADGERQLDVVAALGGGGVAVARLRVDRTAPPHALAAEIERHASAPQPAPLSRP